MTKKKDKNITNKNIETKFIPLTPHITEETKSLPFLLKIGSKKENNKDKEVPKLNLSLVIDASPSMQGTPLNEAKNAAKHVIERLSNNDRVSIVAYSTNVRLLSESMMISDSSKQNLLDTINNIEVFDCSTALYDGWLAGANSIAPFATKNVISRVLLLSDGQANSGLTNVQEIGKNVNELFEKGQISTSTYGIGYGFNEMLMTEMALKGSGRAFYAETSKELYSYFEQELVGLNRLVGQKVKADIKVKKGNKKLKTKWLNSETGVMSNIISGTDSWLMGEIIELDKLPKTKALPELKISTSITWIDNLGNACIKNIISTIFLKNKTGSKNKEVEERLKEIKAAKLQEEAKIAAQEGRWEHVNNSIQIMRSIAGNNAYIKSVSENLNTLYNEKNLSGLLKETQYGAYLMNTRQVSQNEDITTLGKDDLGLRKSNQGKV